MILEPTFYQGEDVCQVARDLLGCTLNTNIDNIHCMATIVETEAYSERERACHAWNGRRTARTSTLFRAGGIAYVYLIYGMYELFNVVTNVEGIGEAVLVRAVEPVFNEEVMAVRRENPKGLYQLSSGPGKLTRAMGIGRVHNELTLQGSTLWIEEGIRTAEIVETTRIGVDYAGEDAKLPWRYYLKDNPWVSKF